MHRIGFVIGVLTVGLLGSLSHAIEPANPNLIPEARAVSDYLASVEGKATLAGVSGRKNAEAIKEVSGKYPAVLALDLSGWNSPPWGESSNPGHPDLQSPVQIHDEPLFFRLCRLAQSSATWGPRT